MEEDVLSDEPVRLLVVDGVCVEYVADTDRELVPDCDRDGFVIVVDDDGVALAVTEHTGGEDDAV